MLALTIEGQMTTQVGNAGYCVIADEYDGKIEGWYIAHTVCIDVWCSEIGTREEDYEVQWDQDLIGPFDTEAEAEAHMENLLRSLESKPTRGPRS
jgi:hypothetical protein